MKHKRFIGDILTIEVRHGEIKTDDLTNISMIAHHYLQEMDMVSFCKVKRNDSNDICTMVCWSDTPAELIRIFLNKYFPLWRWTVND